VVVFLGGSDWLWFGWGSVKLVLFCYVFVSLLTDSILQAPVYFDVPLVYVTLF
jgi:hypothetical protein